MVFIKNNLGIILTVFGMLCAIAGQIITEVNNNKLEKLKKEKTEKIQTLIEEGNKISNENKLINEKNNRLTERISKLMNNQIYFNGFDHSFILKKFPDQSAFVFRQTIEGDVYKKSISNNSELYENFDAKIIFDGSDFIELNIVNKGTIDSDGIRISNVTTPVLIGFGEKFIGVIQPLKGQYGIYKSTEKTDKIEKSELNFFLIDIDDNGFTYAIGRIPRELETKQLKKKPTS